MHLVELNKKIDKSAWHSDDANWLKQRKQQWKKLSAMLKKEKTLLPKDIRYFKNYFLTGELHQEEDEFKYPHTSNDVIIMMFHPDQSEANLLAIYNAYHNNKPNIYSGKFFIRSIGGADFGAEGVLGGNEALYCKILFGTTNEDFAKLVAARNPSAFPIYCQGLIPFLLSDKSYIHTYQQYITDFSFYAARRTNYEFPRFIRLFNQFLQIICYYELLDPFKGIDELRYQRAWALVNKVRDKLKEPDLPQPLLDIWQHIQTSEGKAQVFTYFQEDYPILKQLTD